jgi:DNA-binding response OmpR family regulator
MTGERILIVEDEPAMLRGLVDNFEFKGYRVEKAADGEEGLKKALEWKPDLVVLDLMLPKINGYEVCQLVREAELCMPIIMLTAKGEESDIVLGLKLGADDYVTKPFSIRVLMARVEAFLRGRRREKETTVRFGDCEIDLASHRLIRDGEEVSLTPKEYALLAYLVENPNRALSREQILDAVWGRDVFVTGRSVDRCVTTLRAKVEPAPKKPIYVRTVRDIGYRFEPPENEA